MCCWTSQRAECELVAVAVLLGSFDLQATSMRVNDVLPVVEDGRNPVSPRRGLDHEPGRGNVDRGGAMASGMGEGCSCIALDEDG